MNDDILEEKKIELFEYIETCIEEKSLTDDARTDIEQILQEIYDAGYQDRMDDM